MSLSLRDQLIAAGLVSKKHAKEANKPVRPPQISRNKPPPLPPAALAAQRTQAEKFARDQALNRKQQEKAERKARRAQLRLLIEQVRIPRVESDDYFNFVDDGKIRRVAVTTELRAQLQKGDIVIASFSGQYDLVPVAAVERIRALEPAAIVSIGAAAMTAAEDDTYKEYVVPDDLKW